MFCRLHEFYVDTGMDMGVKPDCDGNCIHANAPGDCKICFNINIPMCKGQKFGWTLTRRIDFSTYNDADLTSDDFVLYQILKLSHPSNDPIWLLRWVSQNHTGLINEYSVFVDKEQRENKVNDFTHLNWWIRDRYKYNGKPIVEEDFSGEEQNKKVE